MATPSFLIFLFVLALSHLVSSNNNNNDTTPLTYDDDVMVSAMPWADTGIPASSNIALDNKHEQHERQPDIPSCNDKQHASSIQGRRPRIAVISHDSAMASFFHQPEQGARDAAAITDIHVEWNRHLVNTGSKMTKDIQTAVDNACDLCRRGGGGGGRERGSLFHMLHGSINICVTFDSELTASFSRSPMIKSLKQPNTLLNMTSQSLFSTPALITLNVLD